MYYIAHRINTINQLKKLDKKYGIEIDIRDNGKNLVGYLRSAVYSPFLKKVIGIAMIKKKYWDKKTSVELQIGNKQSKGKLCDLPFI